jgi:hypothetical protein
MFSYITSRRKKMNGGNKRRRVHVWKAGLFVLSFLLVVSFGMSVEAKSKKTLKSVEPKVRKEIRSSTSYPIYKYKCPDSVKYRTSVKPQSAGPWKKGPDTTSNVKEAKKLFNLQISGDKMVCNYQESCAGLTAKRPFPPDYECEVHRPTKTFICKRKGVQRRPQENDDGW